MKYHWQGDLRKNLLRLVSSIRFRLTLWYMLILTLGLGLFAGSIYVMQSQTLDTNLVANLRDDTSQVLTMYTASDTLPTPFTNQELPPDKREVVLVFSPQGTLLHAIGEVSSKDLAQLQVAARHSGSIHEAYHTYKLAGDLSDINKASGDYLFSTTLVKKGERVVATLLVGLSKERNEQDEQRLLQQLLIIVPLILTASAMGGLWLAVRAMYPVRVISHAAREISETDLSRRLNLKGEDELAELAAIFDHMLARLQSAFERQRRFTSDTSHELRTPLTVISWQVNQALEEQHTPEEYKQSLAIIQVENNYMIRMVNDLLMLARADAGQVTLEVKDVDIGDVVLEVVERLASLAQQKGVTIICGDLPELQVAGDRLYLIQLLTNLVENAIKYTRTRVLVGVHIQQPNWSKVYVEDDGVGISEEHLPYLFDRFYRVDNARTHNADSDDAASRLGNTQQGSGLGLSIAQWIAQAHGGKILVQSKVETGTTFEVWLPLGRI